MKFLCKCIQENLKSPLTYIAAILFAVLCAAGVTVELERETYSFFEVMTDRSLQKEISTDSQYAAYLIAMKFSQSAWYPIGLAVLTAIPALYTYIRSIEKTDRFSLIRSNYKSYTAGVILSSFISGLGIVLAGLAIYYAVTWLTFPSISSFDPILELVFGSVSKRLFTITKFTLNHAFVGGMIPVFAITLYRYIRSDFLAATIPMMLMYISVKVIPNYREWMSTDIQRSENLFAKLLVFLFPSAMPGLGNTLELSFSAPFWLAYIVFGAFIFAMYLLFYRSIRRA